MAYTSLTARTIDYCAGFGKDEFFLHVMNSESWDTLFQTTDATPPAQVDWVTFMHTHVLWHTLIHTLVLSHTLIHTLVLWHTFIHTLVDAAGGLHRRHSGDHSAAWFGASSPAAWERRRSHGRGGAGALLVSTHEMDSSPFHSMLDLCSSHLSIQSEH